LTAPLETIFPITGLPPNTDLQILVSFLHLGFSLCPTADILLWTMEARLCRIIPLSTTGWIHLLTV
jgi:hypothetical protein